MEIDGKTTVYCVIGNPIGHSLSPALHNAAFQSAGLNNVYTAFQVIDVGNAVRGFRGLGIKGISVTIPHKVSIIPYLDEIDSVARNIGAVNTIVNKNGRLMGYNTDGFGALKALRDAGTKVEGKEISIIGSGGAARAIAFTLAMEAEPASIHLLGIEKIELESLSAELKMKTKPEITYNLMDVPGWQRRIDTSSIIIHCTPTGMHPNRDASLLQKKQLMPQHVVFDIVYNPRITSLLKFAREVGCKTVSGLEMFLNQAALQYELWTGQKAPVDIMREILEGKL